LTDAKLGNAVAVAVPTILLIIIGLFAISYLATSLLGLPVSLGLPLVVRATGGATVVAGLAVAAWIFAYRSPADMIVSTYITFRKLLGRAPVSEPSGRTEPLVIDGPQRHVRNPLYLGVVVIVFGWALAGDYTFVLVADVVVLLWFRLVLIPFEERELCALFGEQYERYMEEVPMLFPFTKRRRRNEPSMVRDEAKLSDSSHN
jgi:protein-S-isoprenylcysteine O-methyltransferase Ste14